MPIDEVPFSGEADLLLRLGGQPLQIQAGLGFLQEHSQLPQPSLGPAGASRLAFALCQVQQVALVTRDGAALFGIDRPPTISTRPKRYGRKS
jgi:hypothetical protein